MKLFIEHIALHRNGICGAPFYPVSFRDPDEGRMLGVVFETDHHVAVFHLDKLALGNIAFGVNSWRGDLRAASETGDCGLAAGGVTTTQKTTIISNTKGDSSP